jgi:hypothetical protein
MKTPKPPPAPDPVKTAKAQTESNVETARMNANLNRLDETDPLGSVRYTDLGNDRWRKDTTLSDVGQRQFDLQNAVDEGTSRLALQGVGQASNVLGTPFSLDGLVNEYTTPMGSQIGDLQRSVGPDDFSADRQRVEQSILSRMEPGFERDRAAMEQRLADQGVPAGSEAYIRQMDELNRQKTDARQQAILAGGQEQSRMFGMDLSKGQFANQATGQAVSQDQAARADQVGIRQRQMQEALLKRSQPINEIGALMGTGQVGMPQFQGTAPVNVAGTDVMGPINQQYASQMAGWNAKNQSLQGLQNGLFNLGGSLGSAALMSDRRVKEDIKRIGTADNGVPLYSYRYIGQPAVHIGTMAQDVEDTHPGAVVEFDGVKHVDYGKLFN